ncbi:MAG: cobalt ABC transporter permease [Nocardioidaceae bacterium]|nr:cobalt ABC transporter permease [Nocardioidaceae bacterium]
MMGRRTVTVVAVVLAVCLLLAGAANFLAASTPDRPDRAGADRPSAGYEGDGDHQGLPSGGLAGVVGVGGTLIVVAGLAMVVRRRSDSRRR